ncbi:MAG: HDIG domain-containing metalloprotein [Clostridiaceae bacterium]
MIDLIKSRLNLKENSENFLEYKNCISDLAENETVCSMDSFVQHSNITCLQHCIYVSYISYLMCRHLGLDYRCAARGGLLHDFFLYDWHITKLNNGLHGFTHPYTALENANKLFDLNDVEKDIIVKHMWPLTIKLPKYKETFIVVLADKYCACMEIIKLSRLVNIYSLIENSSKG